MRGRRDPITSRRRHQNAPYSGGGAPAFYVSNAGDDGNDGSIAAPLATLAAVGALLTGVETVYLDRGSEWPEELTDWPAGVTVRAYGAGVKPSIIGYDVALNANFVSVGGATPNVYSIAWTHGFDTDGGKCKHRAWEAGAMMTRVASVAACNTTPGTFYAAAPTNGGPDLIYIHPLGSTNPISDGKVYWFSARRWCVQLYESANQANIHNVNATGNAHADGAICVDGYAEGCTVTDGRYHSFFLARGELVDCVATRIDLAETFTMFVAYCGGGVGSTGSNAVFTRCTADAEVETVIGSGFYAHTDGVAFFDTVQYEGCESIGSNEAFGGTQADVFLYYKCTSNGELITHAAVGRDDTVILGGSGKQRAGASNNGAYVNYTTSATFNLLMHGCKSYKTGTGIGPMHLTAPNLTGVIDRCTMVHATGGTSRFEEGNVTLRRSIILATAATHVRIGTAAAQIAAFDTDDNCYWNSSTSDGSFNKQFGGSTNYVLATWRTYLESVALGAGRDADSLAADPLLADPANGNFTVGNATLVSLGIGAEQDADDDPELLAYWEQYRVD